MPISVFRKKRNRIICKCSYMFFRLSLYIILYIYYFLFDLISYSITLRLRFFLIKCRAPLKLLRILCTVVFANETVYCLNEWKIKNNLRFMPIFSSVLVSHAVRMFWQARIQSYCANCGAEFNDIKI